MAKTIDELEAELTSTKAQLDQLAPQAAKASELEKSIASLTKEKNDLLQKVSAFTQESFQNELKTKFPGIPEDMLIGNSNEEKLAYAEKLFKFKNDGKAPETIKAAPAETGAEKWKGVPSASAHSAEQEAATKAAAEAEKVSAAVKAGDHHTVIGTKITKALGVLGLVPAGAK